MSAGLMMSFLMSCLICFLMVCFCKMVVSDSGSSKSSEILDLERADFLGVGDFRFPFDERTEEVSFDLGFVEGVVEAG